MTYTIDHKLSKEYRTAVIVVQDCSDPHLLKELYDQESHWQKRDGKKIAPSQKFPFYRLRPLNSYALLQKLAATGRLLYQQKPLICDFFSPLKLECIVEENDADTVTIEASFAVKNGPSRLVNRCDLLLQGSPHYVIMDQFLRFIDSSICWKTLEMLNSKHVVMSVCAYNKLKVDLADEEIELCEFLCDSKPDVAITPCLELVDYTLGFANMHFEGGKKGDCQDPAFEKALITAGFIKKPLATSNYFCPLDSAPKVLQTLIAQGWKVKTRDNKELLASSDTTFSLDKTDTEYILNGTCTFGKKSACLFECVQAYQANRKAISLDANTAGLISFNGQEKFLAMLPEIELVSDTLRIKKESVGILSSLIDEMADGAIENEVRMLLQPDCGAIVLSDHFSGTLRAYQEYGVSWMHHHYRQGRSILMADEMGLGKTVQVLAFLATLDPKDTTLIVVPTTLIHNWMNEIQRFLPHKKAHLYHGPKRMLDATEIIVTSFATCRLDIEHLQQKRFTCVVVDEAQSIKNKETKLAQALCEIPSQFRLSLTGTPIENSLSELVNHFSFLQPTLFRDTSYEIASPEVVNLVKKKASPYILRRKKSDVAKDLPEKVEQTVFIEMSDTEKALHESLIKQFYAGLIKKISLDGMQSCRMQVFEAILRLRQIACHPLLTAQLVEGLGFSLSVDPAKFSFVLDDIETLLQEGKKVLVFSQFTSMLALFSKEATARKWPHLQLEGKTKNRQALVDRFQNDPAMQLFFISVKAGGVGLNLTQADYVLLYDPWFNRAIENQAIDRAHRIGRKDTVFAKRYIVKDTIEEKILALQEKKQALFTSIVDDDAESFALTDADMLSLFYTQTK